MDLDRVLRARVKARQEISGPRSTRSLNPGPFAAGNTAPSVWSISPGLPTPTASKSDSPAEAGSR